MKNLMLAAVLALGLAGAANAQNNANFTGPRAQISVGFNDVHHLTDRNDVNYNGEVGYDIPLGNELTLGAAADLSNAFQSTRSYGASARLGIAVTPRVLVFGKGGYADYRTVSNHNLDGLGVGGGVQFALTPTVYLTSEYKYADLTHTAHNQSAFIGGGVRF